MIKYISMLTVLIALLGSGCGTLNPEGPYKGDKVLYDAELLIDTAYTVTHQFVIWEASNRAALSPEVTKAADKIRIEFPKYFNAAYVLKDSYTNNPSNEARDSLQITLNVLRSMMSEAVKIMAENKYQTIK